MKKIITTAFLASGLLFAGASQATVILNDQYTTTNPATGTYVTTSFTSDALVGGTVTYTVNAGIAAVGYMPNIVFFGDLQTVADMYTTLSTIAGNVYNVSFDTLQEGGVSTHAIQVSALSGVGVAGVLLASSPATGINVNGQSFSFTADSTSTTLRILGISGTPNLNEDIGFDNLVVSTAPEPSAFLLMGSALVGLTWFRRKSMGSDSNTASLNP